MRPPPDPQSILQNFSVQNMASSHSSTPPSSSGNAAGKRKLSWGNPNQTKKSPPKNAGVRVITMGGWQDPTAPGPYAYIDMNGTRHNVTRTHPLLGPEQPHSLLLDGYYDVGWSGKHGKHSVKTITKRHAELVCDRIIARCADLTFSVDLSNGQWRPLDMTVFFDEAGNRIALVGTEFFSSQIGKIISDGRLTITTSENISWAMAHSGTVVTGTNDIDIEKIATDIVDMLSHFGAEAELLEAPQEIGPDDQMTRG